MAETGPLSGFRDMLAEQMIPRKAMLATIEGVYERYGFTPLKTPAIERLATLTGKYGEEGDKLMYKFKDNGERDVALRYDLTVPLARIVAQHNGELPHPYKRYAVGEVWRGESPQAGRYREFTQFDADIVGASSPLADAEIVCMMSDTIQTLGADALVRVNNRRILDALVDKAGVQEELARRRFIGIIDKVEKVGVDAVLQEITANYNADAAALVRDYLSTAGSSLERLERIRALLGESDAAAEGIGNLEQVFGLVEAAGYEGDKVAFDPTIARGLDYYTGIIYETQLKGAPELGSVCSGGRYDKLVGLMGGPDLPAVGTSIGVDRLYDGLKKLNLLKEARTNTQVLITNFAAEEAKRYLGLAEQLRRAGIPTEVYYETTKLAKQLSFANRQGIPYVVVVGPQEVEKNVAVIKSMATGEQTEAPLDNLADAFKKLAV
ncbi:MAG TPA: histidine--tRNA ligase [Candidatus Saccharimonadales bacterium]|nr:histidine--tRNA ligase [Candidatus Saccharimonadales bacterium]